MIVVLTDEAVADIEAIGDYIDADNTVRAGSFIRELRARCAGLATT